MLKFSVDCIAGKKSFNVIVSADTSNEAVYVACDKLVIKEGIEEKNIIVLSAIALEY